MSTTSNNIQVGDIIEIGIEDQKGRYLARQIFQNRAIISPQADPNSFNALVFLNGKWSVEGAEQVNYEIRKLDVDLEKEYIRASLSEELVNETVKGLGGQLDYEMRNIFERWLLSVHNEHNIYYNNQLLPDIDPKDPVNVKLVDEILEKGIRKTRTLAEALLAQLQEIIKKYNLLFSQISEDSEVIIDNDKAYYKDAVFELTPHVRYLFENWSKEDVMRMLLRYKSILPRGQHWGIPWPVTDLLYQYGFRNEGFASPLNSRFIGKQGAQFGSLFKDTDSVFGSFGSFLDADMGSHPGDWTINPPYIESLFDAVVPKILDFLNKHGGDRRVFVLMPMWKDTNIYQTLSKHPLLVAKEEMAAKTFYYQDPDKKIITPPRGSAVYFILGKPMNQTEKSEVRKLWYPPGSKITRRLARPTVEDPFKDRLGLFQSLEARLNQAKDSLDVDNFNVLKDNDSWERAIVNMRTNITEQYNGEGVTKAWLKMYEMLNLPDVAQHLIRPQINCFFNAELPGGFVFATNHWISKFAGDSEFKWFISSFYPQNPDGKDFLGDTFGLIENNSNNSLVGPIGTNMGKFWSGGDLTNPKVPEALSTLANSVMGGVDLYTSDGGFDVTGRENSQERLSVKLILGEVETGLRSLNQGGVFILKLFTFFSPEMRTLLLLLYDLFETPHLYKPFTSGPLNSEIYFIGIGFKGASDEIISSIHEGLVGKRKIFSTNPLNKEIIVQKLIEHSEAQISNIEKFLRGESLDVSNLDSVTQGLNILDSNKKLV